MFAGVFELPTEGLTDVSEVIKETTAVEIEGTYVEEPVVLEIAGTEPVETESRIDFSAITNDDTALSSKVLPNEEEPMVETETVKEKETETAKETEKEKEKETKLDTTVTGNTDANINDSEDTEPLSKVLELTETSTLLGSGSLPPERQRKNRNNMSGRRSI
ncbi:hypothetical protein F511_42059 [Dorcoceras hygrometricum]|uniref:Uncharacterized protein n=1 Tax=Dorcoceras hygrometricum TaxID=472368 RepID=A0A2Z7ANL7_9LAMI|nr:hypothetical protein F511_42059 [Dorcoceras hygrometricum]